MYLTLSLISVSVMWIDERVNESIASHHLIRGEDQERSCADSHTRVILILCLFLSPGIAIGTKTDDENDKNDVCLLMWSQGVGASVKRQINRNHIPNVRVRVRVRCACVSVCASRAERFHSGIRVSVSLHPNPDAMRRTATRTRTGCTT